MSTPPNPEPGLEPELVNVFDTEQESEALVVKSLLESAGIQAVVVNQEAQDVFPVGGVVVRVKADQADEAKRIIEDYQSTPEVEPDEDDEDSDAETSG